MFKQIGPIGQVSLTTPRHPVCDVTSIYSIKQQCGRSVLIRKAPPIIATRTYLMSVRRFGSKQRNDGYQVPHGQRNSNYISDARSCVGIDLAEVCYTQYHAERPLRSRQFITQCSQAECTHIRTSIPYTQYQSLYNFLFRRADRLHIIRLDAYLRLASFS